MYNSFLTQELTSKSNKIYLFKWDAWLSKNVSSPSLFLFQPGNKILANFCLKMIFEMGKSYFDVGQVWFESLKEAERVDRFTG